MSLPQTPFLQAVNIDHVSDEPRWDIKKTTLLFFCHLLFIMVIVLLVLNIGFYEEVDLSFAEINATRDSVLVQSDQKIHQYINLWYRSDTAFYLKIAAQGYSATDGSIAFAPLYPFLIRTLGKLLGDNYLLAGLLLTNTAALIGVILLYKISQLEIPTVNPQYLIIFYLTFPFAFYLAAAYTEALFLLFVFAGWLLARKKQWLAAALVGVLAAFTRHQGILLAPIFLLVYFLEAEKLPSADQQHLWRELFNPQRWRAYLTPKVFLPSLVLLLPILPFPLFSAWLRMNQFGNLEDALLNYFDIRTVLPWEGVVIILQKLFAISLTLPDVIDFIMLVFFSFLTIYSFRRIHPALTVYLVLNLALLLTRATPLFLMDSFGRYALTLFPGFLAMALLFQTKPSRLLVTAVFFIFQTIFLYSFLNWLWVG